MSRKKVLFSNAGKTNSIATLLGGQLDSVEIQPFGMLREGLQTSIDRKSFYDRIIFTEKSLGGNPSEEIAFLRNYLEQFSPATEVVMIFRSGEDRDEIVSIFENELASPLYTVAKLFGAVTTDDLKECFSWEVSRVKAKHYTLSANKPAMTVAPSAGSVSEGGKPKKKGFFSSLFGGGKKKKNKQVEAQETASIETGSFSGVEEVPAPVDSFGTDGNVSVGVEDEFSSGGDSVVGVDDGFSSIGESSWGVPETVSNGDELASLLGLGGGVALEGYSPTTVNDEDSDTESIGLENGLNDSSPSFGSISGNLAGGNSGASFEGVASPRKSAELSSELASCFSGLVLPLVVFGDNVYEVVAGAIASNPGIAVVDNTSRQGMQWLLPELGSERVVHFRKEHHSPDIPSAVIILEDLEGAEKYRGSNIDTLVVLSDLKTSVANSLITLDNFDYELACQLAKGQVRILGDGDSFRELCKDAVFSSYDWKGLVA